MDTGLVRELADNILTPTEGETRFIEAVAFLADRHAALCGDPAIWQQELPTVLCGLNGKPWTTKWQHASRRLEKMAVAADDVVSAGDCWLARATVAIRVAQKRQEFWSSDEAGEYYSVLDDLLYPVGYSEMTKLERVDLGVDSAYNGLLDASTHYAWCAWLLLYAAALEVVDTDEVNRLAENMPAAPVAA